MSIRERLIAPSAATRPGAEHDSFARLRSRVITEEAEPAEPPRLAHLSASKGTFIAFYWKRWVSPSWKRWMGEE